MGRGAYSLLCARFGEAIVEDLLPHPAILHPLLVLRPGRRLLPPRCPPTPTVTFDLPFSTFSSPSLPTTAHPLSHYYKTELTKELRKSLRGGHDFNRLG